MSLYLFTNAQFSLAVCAAEDGTGLPAGEWTLLKQVDPTDIDDAIVARVQAEGYWFYKPGQAAAAQRTEPGGSAATSASEK